MPRRRASAAALRRLAAPLDRLYHAFDRPGSAVDPVHVLRRYPAPADREVVGFCAAGLAFGRVAAVIDSIEAVLAVLGPAPAEFVRRFDPARDADALRPLAHRWIRGVDVIALLWVLRRMLAASGSIERFFLEGDDPAAPDVGPALDRFAARALAVDVAPVYGDDPRRRVAWFFPRPAGGSACKRLNLFLRWMVRRDAVDRGTWSGLPASRLVVPLDTHVSRVGRCLRLTRYRGPGGWAMAAEITESLRRLDARDPVRYDFSLCHLGMMDACGFGRPQRDDRCPLRGVCRPGGRRGRRPPPGRD